MTVIIAGTVRVPPENLAGLKPHMLAMLTASRAEDGCHEYSYAEDVAEPGLIRVYEAWRAAWPGFGVSDRKLFAYETASQRPL